MVSISVSTVWRPIPISPRPATDVPSVTLNPGPHTGTGVFSCFGQDAGVGGLEAGLGREWKSEAVGHASMLWACGLPLSPSIVTSWRRHGGADVVVTSV